MTDELQPAIAHPPPVSVRWLRWNLQHLFHLSVLLAIVGWFWSEWLFLLAGAMAIGLALLLADGIARPGSALFYPTITHGPRNSECVALTFDDGPDPEVTPQVLDALARAKACATFFVIGKSLAAQPALAARMAREGHAVGSHSWQHSRLQNFYFSGWQRQELEHSLRAIAEVTGRRPLLYRPPVGLKNWAVARAVWQQGLILVAWSLHSRDTRLSGPEQIAERVLKRIRSGDIVLLHDGHDLPGGTRPHCAEAVRLILAGLQAKGLACVTVPELLGLPESGPHRQNP